MKKILLSLFLVLLASSCSFFNGKLVEVGVDSMPRGANIYIDSQYYGKTPAVIKVPPKETFITVNKEGYGSASAKASIFMGAIRTKANGKINADGVRCLLDSISVIFSFQAYTSKCTDFKEKQYTITIPNNHQSFGSKNNISGNNQEKNNMQNSGFYNNQNFGSGGFQYDNGSIVGAGNSPQNVINYYYDDGSDVKNNKPQQYQDIYKNLDYQRAR